MLLPISYRSHPSSRQNISSKHFFNLLVFILLPISITTPNAQHSLVSIPTPTRAIFKVPFVLPSRSISSPRTHQLRLARCLPAVFNPAVIVKHTPIFQTSSKTLFPACPSQASALIMFSIPPSVRRLVFLFLIAAPLLSIVLPVAAAPAGVDPPSKLQPRAPQPSRRMGATKRSKKIEPLKKKDYSSFLCPGGSVACPIPGDEVSPSSVEALEKSLNSLADWFKVGFECVELETELNSCGGCLALGSGYVSIYHLNHSCIFFLTHTTLP